MYHGPRHGPHSPDPGRESLLDATSGRRSMTETARDGIVEAELNTKGKLPAWRNRTLASLELVSRPVVLLSNSFRILGSNRACRDELGADEDVNGRPCHEVFHRSSVPCGEAGAD